MTGAGGGHAHSQPSRARSLLDRRPRSVPHKTHHEGRISSSSSSKSLIPPLCQGPLGLAQSGAPREGVSLPSVARLCPPRAGTTAQWEELVNLALSPMRQRAGKRKRLFFLTGGRWASGAPRDAEPSPFRPLSPLRGRFWKDRTPRSPTAEMVLRSLVLTMHPSHRDLAYVYTTNQIAQFFSVDL